MTKHKEKYVIKDMRSLLEHESMGMYETGLNDLAKWVRGICFDLNLKPTTWNKLLNSYMKDTFDDKLTPAKIKSDINNINQTISKKSVSWKLFKKFLKIISKGDVHMSFEYEWDAKIKYPNQPVTSNRYTLRENTDDLRSLFNRSFKTVVAHNLSIWNILVNRFVERIYPKETKDIILVTSNFKGNIKKKLDSNKVKFSINEYFKMMAIMGCKKVTIKIKLPIGNERFKNYEYSFELNPDDYKD